MTPTAPTPSLTETPWGPPQSQQEIAPGLMAITTAGHGGLAVSDTRWQELEAHFPGMRSFAGHGWLEEDEDWGLAVLMWPDLFTPQAVFNALRASGCRRDQCVSAAWNASVHGQRVQAIAAVFARTIAGCWEAGGMSAPVPPYPKGSWAVHVTLGSVRKVVVFPDYPRKQFYSDQEIAELPVLS